MWTDVIQMLIMFGTLSFVIIKGTLALGGLSVVFQKNYEGGRILPPNWSLDPTIRHSIWSVIIGGGSFYIMMNSTNQMMVQRYFTLPNLRASRQAVWVYIISTALVMGMGFYNGLLIYTKYHDCDPLTTKVSYYFSFYIVDINCSNFLSLLMKKINCFH